MEESTSQELSTPLLAPHGRNDSGFIGDVEDGGNGLPQGQGGRSDALINPDDNANDSTTVTGQDNVNTDQKRKQGKDNTTPIADYESHFTLRIPTSTVHFRGSVLRVIDTDQDQIILQQRTRKDGDDGDDDKQEKVLVKRLSPGTYAQRFLRVGYTLITILFLGFLFVFCMQVLLSLFIALPVNSGITSGSNKVKTFALLSTLLSLPVMMYGMSSLMAMGSAFVVDTYNGAALFRSTIVEIAYMCVFLVIPILTFAITLMAQSDEPWRITARVWAIMVCITFIFWGLAVTYKQVKSCFWLVERHFHHQDENNTESFEDTTLEDSLNHNHSVIKAGNNDDDDQEGQESKMMKEAKRLLKIANRALILTQTARYSGEKKQRFHFMEGADITSSFGHEIQETSMSLYSRLTAFSFCSKTLNMFETLDLPKKIYSSEEVRDIMPFMTKNNWSMQKMWCSGDSRHHNVVVARGPSALTLDQIKYSVVCTITSAVMLSLLLIGVLVWMGMGAGIYVIATILLMFCCIYPIFKNAQDMYRMYESVENEDVDVGDDANLFQIWETVRITEPKPWYCYARVSIEFVFLFLWPFISMLVSKNYPVAFIFVMLGSFTFLWRYFDASAVLSELGSISDASDETSSHKQMYRLNEVIGRIITSKGQRWWSWIFIVFSLAILFLFLESQGGTETINPDQREVRPPILLLEDFEYPPQVDTLAYPTCKLSKGFEFPGGVAADLGDYAFLSAVAYEQERINNYTLTKWFGPGEVVDEDEFVTQYRKDSGTDLVPVYFKLFSLPSSPGYAVMSIRGSETAFDWIVDAQIWSPAALAQMVKWLTPFGWIWGPILPDLIYLVSKVESESISSVSYYKITTQFVNDVLAGYGGDRFSNLHVTGTSLGGGLAIITGAQTDAFAVAISGMGATLSRESFDPPVQLEKLNSQTFNFIPERDFVARVGGRAPLFQNAQCIAPMNDLFGCHSVWRSICEIAYKCGSNSRPVPCRCVEQFGYPEPDQMGTRSFAEACQQANTDWYEMFPPS